MRFVAKLLIVALVLLGITWLLPGFEVSGLYSAIVIALVLGIINITLKPILILLTLPINIVTLGLFVFVINALLLWLVSTFIEGFEISGFVVAFIAAVILSLATTLTDRLLEAAK